MPRPVHAPAVFCPRPDAETGLYDVAVIGAGPSGLSSALNAASEGLSTVLLADVVGGQAGTSSLIENYLGFGDGISGPDLTAQALRQCEKFGADIQSCSVVSLHREADGTFTATTAAGGHVRARSVVVASGARYNMLSEETDANRFEVGVHYSCVHRDLEGCRCRAVAVVGGGNSAGQAAMFLSQNAERVHLLVRRDNLNETMSSYLIRRIEDQPNIQVHYQTEIDRVTGVGKIDGLSLKDGSRLSVTELFVMIGARPNTGFLEGVCCLDKDGFVETDALGATDMPGLYAVGDVRSGSVKRVANAVGEGAAVIPHVWNYLKQQKEAVYA